LESVKSTRTKLNHLKPMKKIFTFCFVALATLAAQAQIDVTFNVDMNGQTVSGNGVHLAGNFNDVNYDGIVENAAYVNWNPGDQPNPIVMTDGDGDGVYSVTLSLVPQIYQFKFINGNGWVGAEDVPAACQVEVNGNDNRFWLISGANTTESMTVCFANCAACGQKTVRFRVDMTQEASGVNPAGVFLAGDFQGWNPATTQMFDPAYPLGNPSGTFEAIVNVGTASSLAYKFINGNDWAFAEAVPNDCATGGNRTATLTSDNTVLDVACFSACGPCQAPTPVFFRVNMSLQTVNPNGPHVAGSFQGWNPGDPTTLMTDPDGDGIYEVTLLLQPGTYEYKFVNGADWADGNESLPAECNVNGNRQLVVGSDPVIEHWCYTQCSVECITDPDPADVTFRVNMQNTSPDPAGVWMIGGFTTPAWQGGATQMTDPDGNGIYECTVNISGSAEIQYKFMNGDVNAPTNEEGAGIIACGVANGVGGYNRVHTRSGLAEVLNIVCFDSCADCFIGVSEANFLNSLNVYPNPANDYVLLSFGQETSNKIYVRILNQLGQVVATQNVGTLPAGNNTVRVELASLSAGIYAVELANGKDRATVQIAVE
jgi:hypothetical protein